MGDAISNMLLLEVVLRQPPDMLIGTMSGAAQSSSPPLKTLMLSVVYAPDTGCSLLLLLLGVRMESTTNSVVGVVTSLLVLVLVVGVKSCRGDACKKFDTLEMAGDTSSSN